MKSVNSCASFILDFEIHVDDDERWEDLALRGNPSEQRARGYAPQVRRSCLDGKGWYLFYRIFRIRCKQEIRKKRREALSLPSVKDARQFLFSFPWVSRLRNQTEDFIGLRVMKSELMSAFPLHEETNREVSYELPITITRLFLFCFVETAESEPVEATIAGSSLKSTSLTTRSLWARSHLPCKSSDTRNSQFCQASAKR